MPGNRAKIVRISSPLRTRELTGSMEVRHEEARKLSVALGLDPEQSRKFAEIGRRVQQILQARR